VALWSATFLLFHHHIADDRVRTRQTAVKVARSIYRTRYSLTELCKSRTKRKLEEQDSPHKSLSSADQSARYDPSSCVALALEDGIKPMYKSNAGWVHIKSYQYVSTRSISRACIWHTSSFLCKLATPFAPVTHYQNRK
jgi:hypothetical protein